jgi:hypothetical protein
MSRGHIVAVEEISGVTDQDAIARARKLFSERSEPIDGFELWDRDRVVVRNSEAFAERDAENTEISDAEVDPKRLPPALA